jgi:hypothetical protein
MMSYKVCLISLLSVITVPVFEEFIHKFTDVRRKSANKSLSALLLTCKFENDNYEVITKKEFVKMCLADMQILPLV